MFKTLFETKLPSSSCSQARFNPDSQVPLGMDVRFGVDMRRPDLLVHEPSEDVLRVVNSLYEVDSSSPIVNSGRHHRAILETFFTHFQPVLDRQASKDIALLEVGCGEGRVVHALAKAGYTDISACEGASFPFHKELTGVKLIHDYARPGIFGGQRFDVIFSKTVFEHIPGLESVLAEMRGLLKPGGVMFFSVPNCEKEIALGDPRMLALQHWNYFTTKSVTSILADTGYDIEGIDTAFGDFFVTCRPNGRPLAERTRNAGEPDREIVAYAAKLQGNLRSLQTRIDALKASGGSVAIYGLDFNLPFMLDWSGVKKRVVDSDSSKWGLLYCNDPEAKICSPDTLLQDPVTEVWVAPLHYDAQIRDFLAGHLAKTTTLVVSLKDAYEKTAGDLAARGQ